MLDIEYNPSGATCYGLSASAMVTWIADFVNTYHAKTTRYPLIYSTNDWWRTCTGNSARFSGESPLGEHIPLPLQYKLLYTFFCPGGRWLFRELFFLRFFICANLLFLIFVRESFFPGDYWRSLFLGFFLPGRPPQTPQN